MRKIIITLIVLITFTFASCSTFVHINTPDIEGAIVKINGEKVGNTPVAKSLSDAIWETYDVEVSKPGYQTYRGQLRKEFKVGTFIGGFFFLWPLWLWVYGPAPYQNITLDPIK